MSLDSLVLISQLASSGAQAGAGFSARSGARRDARTLRDIGRISAEDVRRSGARVVGAQLAAFGAAGVDPGSGTPLEVMRATTEETELEALLLELAYTNRAIRERGDRP